MALTNTTVNSAYVERCQTESEKQLTYRQMTNCIENSLMSGLIDTELSRSTTHVKRLCE